MMKNLRHCYLLVVALLFGAGLGPARAQSFHWSKIARAAIDSTAVQFQAAATDATGNTYVAVQFRDSLQVGSRRLLTLGARSVGLVKYDSTGVVLWAKLLRNLTICKLAADNTTGGVYLTAAIGSTGGATWDGTAVALPANTVFYGKFSTASALQWTQTLPVYTSGYYGPSIVADAAGNAYILGTVANNTTFNGTNLLRGQSLILKINATGSVQWTQLLHNNGSTTSAVYTTILGPKPGGGCLVSGQTGSGPVYLGVGTGTVLLTGRTMGDYFVSSFDAAGAHQWSQFVGNATGSSPALGLVGALAADAAGNSYVTGNGINSLPLGGLTVNGFFLAKYDATGAIQWVRNTSTSGNNGGAVLAVGNDGPTVAIGSRVLSGQAAPLAGSLVLRSPMNLVHYTAQGLEQWTVGDTWPGYTAPAPPYFSPLGLGRDAHGSLYPVGQPQFGRFRATPTPLPAIVLGAQTTVGNGVIVSRLNAYANTLRGQVYLDQNANGQLDAGELPFPRPLTAMLTQGSSSAYSAVSSTGEIQAYANAGAYTLALAQVPAHYVLTQPGSGSFSGTFSGSSQLVTGQDFGLVPQFNVADVRITLTPYSTARPGFTTSYRVSVENTGTATASGTATVVLDSHFTYVGSTPSATRTGQTLTWTYTNLAPLSQLQYDILSSLPTNTVPGTALTTTATAPLTGDVEPADNTSVLAQPVVAAYDPNSIKVNYERITPTQVAAQQWLEYTIHFQNLGSAAATNVILSDTLDYLKLNPATIQWITQSHNCMWSLSSIGPDTGLLTVRFLGINLPERNVDVIRSQGFVRFRVRARPTLAIGEVVPNQADIVFDYNSPVITNTATTTVFLATAALGRHDAPAWDAYPNPATDAVTIAADLATAGTVRVELLDVLGRPVRQQTLTAPAGPLRQTVNLQGLAAGVYVLRLTPPTGPATSRQLVRQ